jgi:carbamoyl-phosphate synthase large subunit
MMRMPASSPVPGRSLRVFVRQPFTQTGDREQAVIQGVFDLLLELDGHPHRLQLLTGARAENSQTFRARFERDTGLQFTPRNFRTVRLDLLIKADAVVVIRTGLSESGAFELAYNIFGGRRVPVFFAIWKNTPIETTLLRELEDLVPIRYVFFGDPIELRAPLQEFFTGRARDGAGRWLADTRVSTGAYGYGFALNALLLEPRVDEGGEGG